MHKKKNKIFVHKRCTRWDKTHLSNVCFQYFADITTFDFELCQRYAGIVKEAYPGSSRSIH